MFLNHLYQQIVSIPLKLLVSSKLLPENPVKDLEIDTDAPIYYVIQRRSTSSFLMLKEKAKQLKLPEPKIVSGTSEEIPNGAVLFLQNKNLLGLGVNLVEKYQRLLERLLDTQKQTPEKHHQLVPVSIYWGRNPGKENSLLRLLFTDTESSTPLRKFFLFLFQGRNSFVRIAKPVDMQQVVASGASEKMLLTKLTRTLRVHFHRHRQAAMGPLISNRRQLITNLVVSDNVRRAIERETKSKNISVKKARKLAEKYADEIASAYSYKTVRILESALTHLWNRIYDGVQVRNVEMVRELATTHEIIYLPCHRSHIDYLLLSYTLYHEGLVPPHIAAGINLNFWPAGPILRRGGAFFLRRSFGGNKLYTAVFNEYIFQLMDRGIPLEFFPEGGRSRTGRLLPPKTGLLAMTLQSLLRGTRKPVAIVPVYIGYERMFEGKSYLNELRGAEKKKESFGQLLGIRKTLKQAFGKVYLNFAEPLFLNQYLDEKQPDWHQYKGDANAKPGWLTPQVSDLANTLMEKINASVTLNSVSLVALILLSTERVAIGRKELESQLELLLTLGKKAPFSNATYLPKSQPPALIGQAEKLGTIFRVANPMGEIITTDEQTAVLLTYYRNNILHIYITSALIASCFLNRQSMTQTDLVGELSKLFPFLKKELFIHWDEQKFEQHIEKNIDVLVERSMLFREDEMLTRAPESDSGFDQLFTHAQIARPTLLRYGIILTLLSTQAGRENLSRQELEKRSQHLAQRIAALYSLNAPEAFDKNLFRNTVNVLREGELIKVAENNNFIINPDLIDLQDLILNKVNIHSKHIMQKTAAWANEYWGKKS
ncbi:glycerol-3-phosphate 1-O-acyltransferase PlsB [Aliikangiella coralliicola]|uniref:Glycerol-3-phosphate acyltransferase n=1 Tax=Aliikangiella coralliicola TaxID=2592383 RepID=A0A545UH68_9GAMM|nr:glycerol-3-phosphate 1-O-acyltransferase PlsB [Aliikangiella coralliicola]TQV88812.1 glycerol-3-phosphate 1-O-acyltransferase PlsB [Aliikangiella coralliicola]